MPIPATMYGRTALAGYSPPVSTACGDAATGTRLNSSVLGDTGYIEIVELFDPTSGFYYYLLCTPAGTPYQSNGTSPEVHGFAASQEIYVDNVTGYGLSASTGAWTIQRFTLMGGALEYLGVSGGGGTPNAMAAPAACPAAPVANFTGDPLNPLQGATVQFTDTSVPTPTSWNWSFTAGTPADSTAQNPTVTYNSVGTFNVSLEAENTSGGDTEIKNGYITVDAFPYPTGSGDEDARYTTKFVDRDMTKLITQYDRNAFSSGSVPFRMTVRGPSNLRRRKTVYKVTKE